jgi:hypothetical protein
LGESPNEFAITIYLSNQFAHRECDLISKVLGLRIAVKRNASFNTVGVALCGFSL